MNMRKTASLASRLPRASWTLLLAVMAMAPATAWAGQVVTLVNGSKLEVETYRMEGSRIVLSLSGGGELGISPQQVSGIVAAAAAPASPTAAIPPLSEPKTAAISLSPSALSVPGVRISPWDPEPGVRVLIGEISIAVGVDANLVEALVEAESKFDPYAVSRRGAMGLMQLMPATAQHYQVKDVFDPRQNLEGGMRHLKFLLERYDDTALALAAYNAGEEVVDRYRGIPPYRETRGYVARILGRLKS
ncbi:MAG: lytic transglycosylase domain-containing protein [Acidobacteria bacterium]|nr:lytic transglycosylase domain-containing protein [Acidobacteriota bacterium]